MPVVRLGQRSRVRLALAIGVAAAAALASGCAAQTYRHGHLLTDADVQQVQPGQSQDEVKLALGTPDTTSTIDGQVYYYISSTSSGYAYQRPKEIDRRVVAVYFNPLGSVERVAHYGMQDGRVVDFATRTTPTATPDAGLIQSLFRNIGKKKLNDANANPL